VDQAGKGRVVRIPVAGGGAAANAAAPGFSSSGNGGSSASGPGQSTRNPLDAYDPSAVDSATGGSGRSRDAATQGGIQ